MQKPETAITQAILKWLVAQGGDGYHVHGNAFQRSGEPDIDGQIYDKRSRSWLHLKLEVKTKEGKPTELQLLRLAHYHRCGYVAGIVTCIEDVEAVLYVYSVAHDIACALHDLAERKELWYWREIYG
jgi:hypothetical protein